MRLLGCQSKKWRRSTSKTAVPAIAVIDIESDWPEGPKFKISSGRMKGRRTLNLMGSNESRLTLWDCVSLW